MIEYGGFTLKTILNEGECQKPRQEIVFDRQMAKNDFVVIDPSPENTLVASQGMPVGELITHQAGNRIVGKILEVPHFEALEFDPYILQWEDQLSTEHYRTSNVIWYGVNSIVVAHLVAGNVFPGETSLAVDSIETDKRTDGKLCLRPGDGEGIISFHAGSSGDDILIGIMGELGIKTFM